MSLNFPGPDDNWASHFSRTVVTVKKKLMKHIVSQYTNQGGAFSFQLLGNSLIVIATLSSVLGTENGFGYYRVKSLGRPI